MKEVIVWTGERMVRRIVRRKRIKPLKKMSYRVITREVSIENGESYVDDFGCVLETPNGNLALEKARTEANEGYEVLIEVCC